MSDPHAIIETNPQQRKEKTQWLEQKQ
jgi:hypothetical protein